MEQKLPPLKVRIAIGAVVLLIALYFGISALLGDGNGTLSASGSIEAVVVNVAPELAGKVLEVKAAEGDAVKANAPLIRLDPSLLAAQRAVAAASLESAKAGAQAAQNQYQSLLEAALAQDKKTRAQDWFAKDPNQFEQPAWYFSRAEQIQAAQEQADAALQIWDEAKTRLADVSQSVEKADFLKAEKRLLDARLAYLTAKDVDALAQNSADENAPVGRYNRTHCGTNDGYKVDKSWLTNLIYGCRGNGNLTTASEEIYNAAQNELDDAEKAYAALLDTQAAADVLQARADVSVAQEFYYAALDRLRLLQLGDQSPAISAAQASADQAQKAAEQAQANLDLLDTQLSKLEIFAPMNGVILTRNVEVGEYVAPGAIALTMADLSNITITVYVPEDRIGEINIGQEAALAVDSFPEITFTAKVVYIADQAEFTPRNVQTVEGRSATVYAVKLKVSDPEGKLKIGMPADVVFK